jgi:hypothetical protein
VSAAAGLLEYTTALVAAAAVVVDVDQHRRFIEEPRASGELQSFGRGGRPDGATPQKYCLGTYPDFQSHGTVLKKNNVVAVFVRWTRQHEAEVCAMRVASVPQSHIYVRHLSHPGGFRPVIRMPDPCPRRAHCARRLVAAADAGTNVD